MNTLKLSVAVLTAAFSVFSINCSKAAEMDTTAPAWAPTLEFTANTSATYLHNNTQGQGSHYWNISVGADYFFNNMYELGGQLNFSDSEVQGIAHPQKTFQFVVGPTFNFLGSPENACFVTTQAGVMLTGNGPDRENATNFAYFLGLGRRVEIVKHVTWKPEIALTGNTESTDDTTGYVQPASTNFEVIPFQFSLLF